MAVGVGIKIVSPVVLIRVSVEGPFVFISIDQCHQNILADSHKNDIKNGNDGTSAKHYVYHCTIKFTFDNFKWQRKILILQILHIKQDKTQ